MPARDASTTRLEAFCDGVFAIAITLLVIEIHAPQLDEVRRLGGLWPALGARWPSYLGYVISFLTIGIMWANHHAMLEYIGRADRAFLLVNVAFLMPICFLPFTTAVLADHLIHPEARTAATAFYGATLVVIAIGFNAVWLIGTGDPSRMRHHDPQAVKTITSRYRLGPLGYAAATALAFVNVWASLATHAALAVLFARTEKQRTLGESHA
jgi:uncharacterized membrane protein